MSEQDDDRFRRRLNRVADANDLTVRFQQKSRRNAVKTLAAGTVLLAGTSMIPSCEAEKKPDNGAHTTTMSPQDTADDGITLADAGRAVGNTARIGAQLAGAGTAAMGLWWVGASTGAIWHGQNLRRRLRPGSRDDESPEEDQGAAR